MPDVLRSTPGSLRSLPPQKNAVLVVELMLAACPNGLPGAVNPGDSRMKPLNGLTPNSEKENILTASLHRDEKTRICRFC